MCQPEHGSQLSPHLLTGPSNEAGVVVTATKHCRWSHDPVGAMIFHVGTAVLFQQTDQWTRLSDPRPRCYRRVPPVTSSSNWFFSAVVRQRTHELRFSSRLSEQSSCDGLTVNLCVQLSALCTPAFAWTKTTQRHPEQLVSHDKHLRQNTINTVICYKYCYGSFHCYMLGHVFSCNFKGFSKHNQVFV